jgi:hypothetical protein
MGQPADARTAFGQQVVRHCLRIKITSPNKSQLMPLPATIRPKAGCPPASALVLVLTPPPGSPGPPNQPYPRPRRPASPPTTPVPSTEHATPSRPDLVPNRLLPPLAPHSVPRPPTATASDATRANRRGQYRHVEAAPPHPRPTAAGYRVCDAVSKDQDKRPCTAPSPPVPPVYPT